MTYEEAVKVITPGEYRRFKGNEYEVLHIARHSEQEPQCLKRRSCAGFLEEEGGNITQVND